MGCILSLTSALKKGSPFTESLLWLLMCSPHHFQDSLKVVHDVMFM